jgi:hypothetical protein
MGDAMWIRRTAIAAIVIGPILIIGSAGVSTAKTNPTSPSITVQPASATVALGKVAHFKARATGTPRPTYQWQVSTGGGAFTNVGVTTPSLSVAASFTTDGNRYRAVISNPSGTVDTQPATLNVDESKYVGRYTLDFTLSLPVGPPLTRSIALTLGQDGMASDGATLDIVNWSASGKTVTVLDGNDSDEYFTYVGTLSSYGIASPKRPGTATLNFGSSVAGTGTFYAQRTS